MQYLINDPTWKTLKTHAAQVQNLHLRDLLKDADRAAKMRVEAEGIILDYSRQNATAETTGLLIALAKAGKLGDRIEAMFSGKKINSTEGRAVLHVALRAKANERILVDGENVVPGVHRVLERIRVFSEEIRSGARRGATGEMLTDVVAIGIGGSSLGPEFVHESLRTDPTAAAAAKGRRLRFLANVDPIDITRALEGLDPARTLVVVISKTFTTAETMLNAKSVRQWLVEKLGQAAVAKHMIAVSTNLQAVSAFGIDPANAFGFWDWVGGRYSVTSAVGVLPLSIQYGYPVMDSFLDGARAIDRHFRTEPFERNLPVLLGLYGVWNSTFLGRPVRALLPYCQSLARFAAHIQQVDMESNGKAVDIQGNPLPQIAGEVDFGEPGTNGQHSFYQLIHQGQVIPADFIGFTKSQQPVHLPGQSVSNHDELMANFFAQPDALAMGKTAAEVAAQGLTPEEIPHRVFPGNRPSNVMLLKGCLDAAATGKLLALYEHRTAVQGFIWNLNSFDQFGVELGKVLAKRVLTQIHASRVNKSEVQDFVPSTCALLKDYLA